MVRHIIALHNIGLLLVECITCKLSGLGAKSVIEELKSRKTVTRVLLGQNLLGDTGTEHLFGFLSSPEGRRFEIADISLNVNKIGDIGLRAIARYLADGNAGGCAVRELFLQGASHAPFFIVQPYSPLMHEMP